jgi:hypothetical protein
MKISNFEVRKDDLYQSRVTSSVTPELELGEVLLKIDRFALTANNVTYGIVGEKLGYWNFFPAESGWGIIPVWGFADVVETRNPDVKIGERLYGYFPMGTHLVIHPGKLKKLRLSDLTKHRAELSPVYNSYARVQNETSYDASMDNERMLLMPLFATSYCLSDFLKGNDYFGATQIIMPSASSKTAIGLAYALRADAVSHSCIGITSSGNRDKVQALGLFDAVFTYGELEDLDNSRTSVIVDMSGNGKVLSDLHAHLGDNMKFTSNVGITHFEANEMGSSFIRERSAMFFAPAHIQKRTNEWGPGVFEERAYRFWYEASLKSRDWLRIDYHEGMDALSGVFAELLAGKVPPDKGTIVSF